jgi:hypothetical protein
VLSRGRPISKGHSTVVLWVYRRTFPSHVFFHQRQGPGQQSLGPCPARVQRTRPAGAKVLMCGAGVIASV